MTKKQKDSITPKKNGVNSCSTGKKKTNRRLKIENPDLNPKYNLKTRTDLLDQDYVHKLSDADAKWLNNFNKEYVNAALDTENLENNLHNTKALKKDCQDRNNARNRCIVTRQKATGRLKNLDDVDVEPLNPIEYMNLAIDLQLTGIIDDNGKLKKKS